MKKLTYQLIFLFLSSVEALAIDLKMDLSVMNDRYSDNGMAYGIGVFQDITENFNIGLTYTFDGVQKKSEKYDTTTITENIKNEFDNKQLFSPGFAADSNKPVSASNYWSSKAFQNAMTAQKICPASYTKNIDKIEKRSVTKTIFSIQKVQNLIISSEYKRKIANLSPYVSLGLGVTKVKLKKVYTRPIKKTIL